MTYTYSRESDVLRIRLSDEPIERTVETEIGLLDLDERGEPVQIEIFAASRVDPNELMAEPRTPSEELTTVLKQSVSEAVSKSRERLQHAR